MTGKQKKALIRILAAAGLWLAVWLLPLQGWVEIVGYCIPYGIVGWDVLRSSARNILHGQVFDEKFLMAVATLSAFAIGEYTEAVAVMLFYQIGEWFQGMAVGRSRRSIASLMDLRADFANVLRNGIEEQVSPDEVAVGEQILIRPGEKIPLDGIIMEGRTTVNTAALTGESLPQDKSAGERVISGSINLSGVITVRTDSLYGESTAARILDLVENASSQKARVEGFITRFARWYTPCVVIAAVFLAVVPPLVLHFPWEQWIRRALIFLVVSCPCALVVSVPLSFFGGIGGASRCGILIKGAGYLETLAKVKTVVFDKTGTLTEGSFSVTAIHPQQVSESELLDLAAAAESFSHHPIAESILRAYGGQIASSRISEVTERAGLGIEAVIDGRRIYAGNEKLMHEAGAECPPCHHSGTLIHLAAENGYLGHIVITDTVKPDAAETIRGLKNIGIEKTVMLTGDQKEAAEAVAAELGPDEWRYELMPADKVTEVEKLLQSGSPVAFVGDGINDAPVLARADIGVAMGALGSDAAIEAADIVLMDDKPAKLVLAVKIARRTMRIVRQNVTFALAVKAVVLLLGALGLANLWGAVFADVGVMVLAILNAMRALYFKQ